MHRVRLAVRENRLVTAIVTEADYPPMLAHGCAFVGDECAGFAIGDPTRANLWALFVDPAHERRGLGRLLHDAVMAAMFARVDRVWLTTEPGTRAERFYRAAGWTDVGMAGRELRFELARP